MMDSANKDIAALQTEVLQLSLKARAGSQMRRSLSEAASWFPAVGTGSPEVKTDQHGGIDRQEIADLLRRINAARENGDDPQRSLRSMRNQFEQLLDCYDLEAE